MKITKVQYQMLDRLQHLWRDINQANAHIKLSITIDDGNKNSITFTELQNFTKAVIDAEQNEKLSLLEIK